VGRQQGPGHFARDQVGRECVAGAHVVRLAGGGHNESGLNVVQETRVLRPRQFGRDRRQNTTRQTHHGCFRQFQHTKADPTPKPREPF